MWVQQAAKLVQQSALQKTKEAQFKQPEVCWFWKQQIPLLLPHHRFIAHVFLLSLYFSKSKAPIQCLCGCVPPELSQKIAATTQLPDHLKPAEESTLEKLIEEHQDVIKTFSKPCDSSFKESKPKETCITDSIHTPNDSMCSTSYITLIIIYYFPFLVTHFRNCRPSFQ